MTTRDWADGTWTVPPLQTRLEGGDLVATAAKGSDAWRTTAHGYITDDAHALLAPLADGEAVEVEFLADLTEQFDQAGLVVRSDAAHWIKAGAEYADGALQLGTVVTRDTSDWSCAPVPGWEGRRVTVSAARAGDAILIRARVDDEPDRLIRVAWFDPELPVAAGPYLAAPSRAGLTVRFTAWRIERADAVVHPDGLPDFAG